MHKLHAFIAISILLWLTGAHAETATQPSLDPTVASPDMYQVLFENEHVRVVEYEISPGQRDNWHAHPPKVSYVVTPGRLQITTAEGESFEVGEDEGTVRWLGAVGKHYGANVGDQLVRILFVEVKGAAEERQDLGKYLRESQDNNK